MSASRLGWPVALIAIVSATHWLHPASLRSVAESTAAVQDEKPVDLFDEMMGIRQAVRSLSQQIDDAAKDEESLKLIWSMQSHIVNARAANPPTLESVAEEQRADHIRAYRKSLAEVLRAMTQMEIDLLDGRRADVKKAVVETLVPLRDAAHDKFQDNG